MGIDIYLKWDGMTNEDVAAQCTGFDVTSGHVGYLREAYHGDPYATQYLVKEAFDSKDGEATIPAKTLKRRLEKTLKLVAEREKKLYQSKKKQITAVQKSFKDFVKLAEKKEKETKKPVTVIASY